MCVRASRSEPSSTAWRSQRGDELDRLQRDGVVERLVVVARVALDRVRERVHPVAAVTAGGSPSMSSGSMSATCAPISGVPPTLNLIFRS